MAAGATYEPIATTTLGSNTTQVDFTGISGSYTDIVAVFNGSITAAGNARFRVNSNSSASYSNTRMYGDGSSAGSGRDTGYNIGIVGFFLANKRAMFRANFMNYSNTSTYKTIIARDDSEDYTFAWVNLWRNTAAISSISFFCDNTSIYYTAGSTFTLYGITAA
jgi:hypothetical protein